MRFVLKCCIGCLVCAAALPRTCLAAANVVPVDVLRLTLQGDLLSPADFSADEPGALFDATALGTVIQEVALATGTSPRLVGMGAVSHDEDVRAGHDDPDHGDHDQDHDHDIDVDRDMQPASKAAASEFYVDLAFFNTEHAHHDDHDDDSNAHAEEDGHDHHDDDHDAKAEALAVPHPIVKHFSSLLAEAQNNQSAIVRLGSFALRDVVLKTSSVRDEHDGHHDDHHDDHHDEGDAPSNEEAWLHALLSMGILSGISLSGGIVILRGTKFVGCVLTELLALGAGSMLGAAFFLLLPEAQHVIGWDAKVGLACLGGAMFGFVGEKAAHLYSRDLPANDRTALKRHTHGRSLEHRVEQDSLVPCQTTEVVASSAQTAIAEPDAVGDVESGAVVNKDGTDGGKNILPLAYASIVGDCICNFVDGALLGAVFLTSTSTGWATALSIFLHELPQEMGDFGIFIHAGFKPTSALALNLLVSLSALLGCVLTLTIGADFEEQIYYLLPIGAGVFIYISMACILPELRKVQDVQRSARALFFLFLGIGLMALMLLLPHEHGGHDDHDH